MIREPQPMKVEAVDRSTFRERIAEALRAAILDGELPPGTPLVEGRLAAQFGVSRGPLREAIRQLTDEGLLTSKAYTATHVTQLTIKDVQEVFALRAALETFAFDLCWPLRDDSFFAELKRRHALLSTAIDAGNDREAILTELDLHSFAFEASDNTRLLTVWKSLRGRLQLYWAAHHRVHGRRGPRRDGHDRYVELALGDDLAAMRAEIKAHVLRGGRRTIEFLREAEQLRRTAVQAVLATPRLPARSRFQPPSFE